MSNFINRRSAVTGLVAAAIGPLWSATARGSAIARGASTTRTGTAADAAALEVLDDTARNLLQLFPESATSLGVDRGTDARLRRRLSDRSAAGQRAIAARLRRDLAKIEAIDPKPLSHSVKTSIEVVRSAYATSLEGFALPYGDITVGGWRNTPYVVIQNVGAYLDVPRFLDSDHPIDSPPDAEAYLERLRQYPLQLDGELERVRAARDMGLIPPAFLLDKTLAQLKLSAKSASEGGVLVDSLLRRTQGMRGQWERDARAIVTGEVIPALNRQINEIEAARKSATDDAGMWARPHGEQFYRWALKASTTTSMTPDEVHALGFEELERLHSQMDVIMRGLGFNSGSVGERMQAIAKDPRYQFAEGDAGRAEIMAFIDARLRWIRKQMPRAFHALVDPNMEVKRLPPEEEPGAPTAYGGAGSIDGRIPGKFWINLRTTGLHSRFALADLAFHESIPGHIWQGEYTHEMPRIRQLLAFNAYSEGWALYAQQLADELGAYENDPVGRLGYLQAISFRACRLVVDTGIHAKRWTREQGVRFFVERNGSNPLEVASEVDRYCSWPGQACGYKVGHSEINRQRDLARSKLGARFDVRDFNDTVLRGGNVPLDVLGSNVAEYVGSSSSD
ncbi:MAG: DUF885 domain-containing protein [Gammaproteobacteria bacterium]|nr:DUF885 domain-containing protein [Gammaproteobacteria bacterium]